MRKLILLTALFTLFQSVKAQTPNWLWAESGMGNGYGYCSGIAIGPNDTVYISGRTGGNLTLANLSLTTFSTIPFVGKYDSAGGTGTNGIWLSDNYPISGFAYADGLCVDGAGSSFITSCDGSGSSVYVEKYNTHGNMSWYTDWGGGNCRGYGIAADNMGNVYSSGNFSSTMTVGTYTLPYTSGSWAGYVIKQDSSGNVKWATYCSDLSGNFVGGRRCAVDLQGDVYVVGSYKGSPTFYSANSATTVTPPTSPVTGGLGNMYVAKYDTSGNILYVIDVPHAGLYDNMYYYDNSIALDSCGNIYVAGIFDATTTFGTLPSITPTGTLDVFVAKYNTFSSTWEWVQTGDGPAGSGNYAGNISLDKTSDVYLSGSYNGASLTFGTNTISGGNNFITKFSNSNGAVQYVINCSIASGGIAGVVADKQNYLYVDGSYGSTSTLGTATLTGGAGSVFLAKLDTIPPRAIIPIVDSTYCPGSTDTLPFSIIGTFTSGNVFTAQLSDSLGSFTNATNIGYDTSTTGGKMVITIPANTPKGVTYLIRIISSSPATSSWANGCGSYYVNNVYPNDFYIVIGNALKFGVAFTDTSVCNGATVKLGANGGGSYMWSNGALTDTTSVSPTDSTTYTVTVTNGGCSGTDSVKVNVNPTGVVGLIPPSTTICAGQNLVIIATGFNSYTWSPDSALSSTTGDTITATPTVTTTYTITGTNSSGCTGVALDTITVVPAPNQPTISQSGDTLKSSAETDNQWYENGKLISSATGQDLVIGSSTDTFTVVVVNPADGCSSSSIPLITSGINQLSILNSQLTIYPNPTSGNLFVTISSSVGDVKDWNLRLTNVLGQTIYTRNSLNYNNVIDLTNLAGGVYFITVTNKTTQGVFPIVKQ